MPGVLLWCFQTALRPPLTSVGCAISPSRSLTSQSRRLPVMWNSLGPHIAWSEVGNGLHGAEGTQQTLWPGLDPADVALVEGDQRLLAGGTVGAAGLLMLRKHRLHPLGQLAAEPSGSCTHSGMLAGALESTREAMPAAPERATSGASI